MFFEGLEYWRVVVKRDAELPFIYKEFFSVIQETLLVQLSCAIYLLWLIAHPYKQFLIWTYWKLIPHVIITVAFIMAWDLDWNTDIEFRKIFASTSFLPSMASVFSVSVLGFIWNCCRANATFLHMNRQNWDTEEPYFLTEYLNVRCFYKVKWSWASGVCLCYTHTGL